MSVLLMGKAQAQEWLYIDKMLLLFGKSKATSNLKFALFVEQGKELGDYFQLSYSRVSKIVVKSKT
ncbi:hypothetical protein AN394_04175 [Pseudoalteromonas sp. P1-26]|nr:hypothetical protein AN394_04175 [Pseudoalteromonas sp. P1-26]